MLKWGRWSKILGTRKIYDTNLTKVKKSPMVSSTIVVENELCSSIIKNQNIWQGKLTLEKDRIKDFILASLTGNLPVN
jgi:hypothetical protein